MTHLYENKNKSMEDCKIELDKIRQEFQQIKSENEENNKKICTLNSEKAKLEFDNKN
jgi:translation initiation factor 2B subunit (eIF-2B alpha/beta/delta family)